MSDPIVPGLEAAAPVAPAVVAEAPALAPVVAEAPPPVVVAEAPVSEAAPAAEASPERPKTLLTKFDEEKAGTTAEAPKEAEAAKPAEEAKTADAPAPPAAEEAVPLTFELPAQLKAAPEQIEAFTDLIRGARSGDPKEAGQKLLDMHAKAMEAYSKEVSDNQWKVWNEMIAAKDKEVLADPIIGGAGHQTAMAAITRMRDMLVPEKDRGPFTEFLEVTGAGSWPVFLRMLHRAAEIFDEPPMPAPNGKPPPDAHVSSGNRLAILHDHPTSQTNGRG